MKQNLSSLTLVPSGGGCFELELDGKRIYSKLETGNFPDHDEIVSKIKSG